MENIYPSLADMGDVEGDTWSHLHTREAQLLDGRHLKTVFPSILPLLL